MVLSKPLRGLLKALKISLLVVPLLLSAKTIASSSGFDFPVCRPDASGCYNAQKFGSWNEEFNGFHLGEDWNKGSGDSDLGEPLYSVADGRVIDVSYRKGWGNVALIRFEMAGRKFVALYGHFKDVYVKKDQAVERGQVIGTIGKGDRNRFPAHLHFEMRDNEEIGFGFGYGDYNQRGYFDPSAFINSHRPVKPQALTAVSGGVSTINLSWTKSEDANFDKSELYRSEVLGGTADPAKRVLMLQATDKEVLTFADTKAYGGDTYYYRLITYYKNGFLAESEEVKMEQKREIVKITTNGSPQTRPIINGDLIIWDDARLENNNDNKRIYYYDIKNGKEGTISIESSGAKRANTPDSNGDWIVFYATDSSYWSTGYNVFAHSLAIGTTVPVTKSAKDQFNAVVSKDGIVVWEDIRSGNSDIYYLNLKDSVGERPLVVASGNQKNPRIWGDRVVWKDNRSGTFDLYAKTIDGQEELLVKDAGDSAPDIWENWIVWEGKGKVSLLDLNTRNLKTIAMAGGGNPRIRDGKIAYSLLEGSFNYIHVYDVASGADTKIDFALPYASRPFISGSFLVFDHAEKATVPDMNIYLTVL